MSQLKHFSDIYISVFNCRHTDVAKGRAAVLKKYGKKGWQKVLDRKHTGIMEIFHEHKRIRETKLFADVVAKASDDRALKRATAEINKL
jgi:hypothetical protein